MKLILALILMTNVAIAQEAKPSREILRAIYKAAKRNGIDAQDLVRIAYIESRFDKQAVRYNTNNSIDYGMFQINSIHWTTTCAPIDIFTFEGNLECAAKIVKRLKRIHSETDEHWLARYHSSTPSKKLKYADLLADVKL